MEKSMETNFPGFRHPRDFAALSMIWEKTMEKTPIQWKLCGNQFLRLFPLDGFYCLFPCYEKLMEKTMYFPYDEVYNRMGI